MTEFYISSIDNEQVDAKEKKAKTGKSSKSLNKTNNESNSDVQCICIRTILAAVSLTRSMLFLITASSCSLILRTVLGSSLHVGQTQNPIISFSDKFTQVTCNHI
jgi:hypothetical protein